jgi:hypothetical protein
VLEVVFVLLEASSPSRRIFIGSHSLPPLWVAVSVLQGLDAVGPFRTTPGGYKHILVAIDKFTKWIEV